MISALGYNCQDTALNYTYVMCIAVWAWQLARHLIISACVCLCICTVLCALGQLGSLGLKNCVYAVWPLDYTAQTFSLRLPLSHSPSLSVSLDCLANYRAQPSSNGSRREEDGVR